jgi:hypothetical protein
MLPKRKAKLRIPSDLQGEMHILAIEKQLAVRRAPYGEPAKHKRPGCKSKRLAGGFPLFPNQENTFCPFELLLRNGKFAEVPLKNLPCMLQGSPGLPRRTHNPAQESRKVKNVPKLVTVLVIFDCFWGFWEDRPEWPKILKPNQLELVAGARFELATFGL